MVDWPEAGCGGLCIRKVGLQTYVLLIIPLPLLSQDRSVRKYLLACAHATCGELDFDLYEIMQVLQKKTLLAFMRSATYHRFSLALRELRPLFDRHTPLYRATVVMSH